MVPLRNGTMPHCAPLPPMSPLRNGTKPHCAPLPPASPLCNGTMPHCAPPPPASPLRNGVVLHTCPQKGGKTNPQPSAAASSLLSATSLSSTPFVTSCPRASNLTKHRSRKMGKHTPSSTW
eukprot:3869695-Lingulodinium_polyedra.AAC.1